MNYKGALAVLVAVAALVAVLSEEGSATEEERELGLIEGSDC